MLVLAGYVVDEMIRKRIIEQAANYGKKVRKFDDLGDLANRRKTRKEWVEIRNTIKNNSIRSDAYKAYWDAYLMGDLNNESFSNKEWEN